MDEYVRLAVIILVKKISSSCHVWIFLTLLYKIICMESILVDINDDDEIAKLLAMILYDEKSSLRGVFADNGPRVGNGNCGALRSGCVV